MKKFALALVVMSFISIQASQRCPEFSNLATAAICCLPVQSDALRYNGFKFLQPTGQEPDVCFSVGDSELNLFNSAFFMGTYVAAVCTQSIVPDPVKPQFNNCTKGIGLCALTSYTGHPVPACVGAAYCFKAVSPFFRR